MAETLSWGILGTANIAARALLPALAEIGGRAAIVGSRSADRAADWAAAHGVGRGGSYHDVLSAADISAVYIPLPNDEHVRWAAQACRAGYAVLCEKPLGLSAAEVAALLAEVGDGAPLWEAFVFPFHPQTDLLIGLIADGRIGRVREIHSEFHFALGPNAAGNIRLQPERGGGALYDVGCYPIRLARLLTAGEPTSASGSARTGSGVDLSMAAVLDFPGDVSVIVSAAIDRPPSTFTRIIGDAGELRVSNPFHPRSGDTVELIAAGRSVQRWDASGASAFSHAIDHIQRVLTGEAAPRHRAVDDALAQARALDLVRTAIAEGH